MCLQNKNNNKEMLCLEKYNLSSQNSNFGKNTNVKAIDKLQKKMVKWITTDL